MSHNVAANSAADPTVRCASYARYSCDLQRDESITDQQRKCREKAAENHHTISSTLEFTDEAVSGTKRHRNGLDAMLAAARARQIDELYFHSLSRLSRESVITLPLLKELVYNYGVRVVSATEGIDSKETSWELIAHIMAIVHEQYVKDLAKNVLRGQEGNVLAGLSVGDFCFGYTSTPLPGSELGRQNRNGKPRKIYVIDPETAAWVERIFKWYVEQRRSLRWIARELNRCGAPKDHRSTTTTWTHRLVPELLRNRKYIGSWPWGEKKNVRDPLTGSVRQVDRSPEECEKWRRDFPHLRLINDALFEEAQRLLQRNQAAIAGSRKKQGRLHGSQPGAQHHHPRHLLSQLIVCGHCGRTFHVGGTNGKYLFCPGYLLGTCPCQTQLPRDRAERMLLAEIGERILASSHWHQRVFDESRQAWKAHVATVPSELAAARRSLAEVDQKIGNLVDRIEAGHGGPELDQRLTKRRAEKRELTDRVERLECADHGQPAEPTEPWVAEQLRNLSTLFLEQTPAAAHALRHLVGGRIVVTEIRQPGRQRYHLQGRFTITTGTVVASLSRVADYSEVSEEAVMGDLHEEIVIDFRSSATENPELQRAWELHELRLSQQGDRRRTGLLARSTVTKLLRRQPKARRAVGRRSSPPRPTQVRPGRAAALSAHRRRSQATRRRGSSLPRHCRTTPLQSESDHEGVEILAHVAGSRCARRSNSPQVART